MSITLEERVRILEDRAAIKEVVDTFSNLADKKNIGDQMNLFTEDAIVETYFGNELFAAMHGKKEIENTFSNFIKNFESMYHINGQLVLELNGDSAVGYHYCTVYLISSENGEKFINTNGVIYEDNYVLRNGKWLISRRISKFTWRDNRKMS